MRKKRIYALYKGDEYLCGGLKQELADYLGVKPRTIEFYMSKAYEKRNHKGNNYKVIFVGVE